MNTLKFSDRPWEAKDHELAKVMSACWANFVKSGDPNDNGLANWLRYDTRRKLVMDLGEEPAAKTSTGLSMSKSIVQTTCGRKTFGDEL